MSVSTSEEVRHAYQSMYTDVYQSLHYIEGYKETLDESECS